MRRFILILAGVPLLIFISCDPTKQAMKKNPTYLAGYKFNPMPNKLDRNGYIYAVHKNTKEVFPVAQINVPIEAGITSLPSRSETVKTDLGSIFNVLGLKNDQSEVSGNLSLNTTRSIVLNFDQASLNRTLLVNANSAIKGAIAQIKEELDIINIRDYNFYMILESVNVLSMNYTFDKDLSSNLAFQTTIEKVAEANPNLQLKKDRYYSLSFKSDSPLNVLNKPFPLIITQSLGGNYDIVVTSPSPEG